jgi:hypothetical protein
LLRGERGEIKDRPKGGRLFTDLEVCATVGFSSFVVLEKSEHIYENSEL